jgi:hypothetical protein
MKTLKEYITEQNFSDEELYENIKWCLSDLLEFNDVDENYLLLAIDEYNSVYKALTEKNVKYNTDYIWKTILEKYKDLIEETINKQQFLQIVKKYDKELTENILEEYKHGIKDLKDEIAQNGKLL